MATIDDLVNPPFLKAFRKTYERINALSPKIPSSYINKIQPPPYLLAVQQQVEQINRLIPIVSFTSQPPLNEIVSQFIQIPTIFDYIPRDSYSRILDLQAIIAESLKTSDSFKDLIANIPDAKAQEISEFIEANEDSLPHPSPYEMECFLKDEDSVSLIDIVTSKFSSLLELADNQNIDKIFKIIFLILNLATLYVAYTTLQYSEQAHQDMVQAHQDADRAHEDSLRSSQSCNDCKTTINSDSKQQILAK